MSLRPRDVVRSFTSHIGAGSLDSTCTYQLPAATARSVSQIRSLFYPWFGGNSEENLMRLGRQCCSFTKHTAGDFQCLAPVGCLTSNEMLGDLFPAWCLWIFDGRWRILLHRARLTNCTLERASKTRPDRYEAFSERDRYPILDTRIQ
jgi:hypothetical protein